LVWQNLQRERNGALFLSARTSMPKKCLTPPTLSETRFINSVAFLSGAVVHCAPEVAIVRKQAIRFYRELP